MISTLLITRYVSLTIETVATANLAQSHVEHPIGGIFGTDCPSSHPVRLPLLFIEIVWDTRSFNDLSIWPEDGSQPFVFSMGDPYVLTSSSVLTSLMIHVSVLGMGSTRTMFLDGKATPYSVRWKYARAEMGSLQTAPY